MGEPGLTTERDIINRFQELQQELNILGSRFNEIDNQVQEHESVIKTLTPLDTNRKCFRLIGGVLVERTIAEVLPSVKSNADEIRVVRLALLLPVKFCGDPLIWNKRAAVCRTNREANQSKGKGIDGFSGKVQNKGQGTQLSSAGQRHSKGCIYMSCFALVHRVQERTVQPVTNSLMAKARQKVLECLCPSSSSTPIREYSVLIYSTGMTHL